MKSGLEARKVWLVAELKDFSWNAFLTGFFFVGGVIGGAITESASRRKSGTEITVKVFASEEEAVRFVDEKRRKSAPVVMWEALMPKPILPEPKKPKSFKEFLMQ